MECPNESEKKQSHSVIESQDQREEEEDSPSQPQTPPSRSTKLRTQDVTPPQKLPPVNRKQEAESKDGTPSKQRRCSCKASRCLQLYCECFASGSYCNGCNCLNCRNNLEYETTSRQEAIKGALERYPNAFNPKIADSPRGLNNVKEDVRQFNRGCNCKRSGCLKNYCGCYQANVRCSEKCRCQGCKNREGSQEIKQTTNADVKVAIGMSCYLFPLESRKSASPSVQARGSSDLVQNQTVDYVVRGGDTSLFTVPDNQAVPGSTTTSTYRYYPAGRCQRAMLSFGLKIDGSSKENVRYIYHAVRCRGDDIFVSEKRRKNEKDSSRDPHIDANVINDSQDRVLDAGGTDEKPMSPATRAVMSDDEHVNTPDKETPAPERTSQEKKDKDTEVYAEQERQILSTFRDHLMQLLNGSNIQKANTDPSRKEPEDEEEPSHRD